MILELCAFNIQSCFVAQAAGAGRIEFCADPVQGGVTPSHGAILYAQEHMAIPVFPMIRPRGGNFIYDRHELEIMRRDILFCKETGSPGIATGIQLPGGRIDLENMKRITAWAYPMQVTCHKVFDGVPDAHSALEDIIAAGCSRVLTSGLGRTAMEGAAVLAALVAQAADRIIIMPGGGVRAANIAQLKQLAGATEYHSSGLVSRAGDQLADEDEVRKMVAAIQSSSDR